MAKVRKRTYNLTGQHIGSLTVVEPCIVNGYAGWKCICDCGVKCEKTTQQLRDVIKGKRKGISCGCNRNRTNGLIGQSVISLFASSGYNVIAAVRNAAYVSSVE